MDPVFIVGVIAIVYSGLIFLVQRHTKIKYGFKEKQAIMKEKQKIISEIYKTKDIKDEEVKKELDVLQKEVMKISMDMMRKNLKNMLWILLISIFVFSYVNTFNKFSFPFNSFLSIPPSLVWYIVVSLIANFTFMLVFKVLEVKGVISDSYG